jgi:ribosomal protein L31E
VKFSCKTKQKGEALKLLREFETSRLSQRDVKIDKSVAENLSVGKREVELNSLGLASGIHLYRFTC